MSSADRSISPSAKWAEIIADMAVSNPGWATPAQGLDDDAEAMYYAAVDLALAGSDDRAIELLRKVVEREPAHVEVEDGGFADLPGTGMDLLPGFLDARGDLRCEESGELPGGGL